MLDAMPSYTSIPFSKAKRNQEPRPKTGEGVTPLLCYNAVEPEVEPYDYALHALEGKTILGRIDLLSRYNHLQLT
jgi:hypothetical protein